MEYVHQSGMILRDLLVSLDAFEFPLESPFPFKVLAPDNLDRPIGSRDAAREKDFPVRTPSDSAEDLELWDNGLVRI
jgi:hypothetical protein